MEGGLQLERPEPRRRRGPFEWLTRSDALAQARARLRVFSPRELAAARSARVAREVADRLWDPIEPPRAGSATPVLADLYRQSAYFALCALQHGGATPPAIEVWNALTPEQLDWALPDPAERAAVRSLMVEADFVSLAQGGSDTQQAEAERARRFAYAMLELLESDQRRIGRLKFQRLVRSIGLVLLLGGAALGGHEAYQLHALGPDLAAGKPWRASSEWARCDAVAERCAGLSTKIFFHTKEDDKPWVEFDLGRAQTFSQVFVRNRSDDAPDRAVPLVVEVSNDQKTYRQVARRKESFREWTAQFSPQTARYVRLRVDRRSYLHLEKVMIYE